MPHRLTLEDFKGKELKNGTPLEILIHVLEVAAEKFKEEETANGNSTCTKPTLISNESSRADEKIQVQPPLEKSLLVLKHSNSKTKLVDSMKNEEWVNCLTNKKTKREEEEDDDSSTAAASLSSLPEEFQREIAVRCGGSEPDRLFRLIRKTLTKTDISKGHGRLTIPCNQIQSFEFLEDDEITLLRQKETIRVPLIHKPKKNNGVSDPSLTETILKFGQWNLHANKDDPRKVSSQYVLNGGWNNIVSEDRLKQNRTVEVWAFRDIQNRLCMALVQLGR
ncbi:putative B3 domain-containing protein At5g35780 [Neltuma alba]|uniref:putative B3 domain-containing protein At5g35780 n=1 Tax=Neltuma alba TaxID=207710 RepID=UPI0010A3D707|nr:putative B3 domain-containing protein At5g35780 [Prosopis alba]